jgi:hypothetical protein
MDNIKVQEASGATTAVSQKSSLNTISSAPSRHHRDLALDHSKSTTQHFNKDGPILSQSMPFLLPYQSFIFDTMRSVQWIGFTNERR